MKEIIGKTWITFLYLPQKILDDKAKILEENCAANEFNDYFTNICKCLARKIHKFQKKLLKLKKTTTTKKPNKS